MLSAVGASARRGWNAVGRFFHSIYLYLERLTRPVLEQGGQTLFPSSEARVTTTSDGSANLKIAWHCIRWSANSTYFLLILLLRPLFRLCVSVFALLGKYFALSLRTAIVFVFYLSQHMNWTGTESIRQWTLLGNLVNIHWDSPYFFSILLNPSMGLRDYRRWRNRRGVRWARPSVRLVDAEVRDCKERWELEDRNWETERQRGGPLLGQGNPFDYVSDDEDGWEGSRKHEVRGAAEHRQAEGQTGYAPGVGVVVEEKQKPEPANRVSIGRKEARRGAKKRKGKR